MGRTPEPREGWWGEFRFRVRALWLLLALVSLIVSGCDFQAVVANSPAAKAALAASVVNSFEADQAPAGLVPTIQLPTDSPPSAQESLAPIPLTGGYSETPASPTTAALSPFLPTGQDLASSLPADPRAARPLTQRRIEPSPTAEVSLPSPTAPPLSPEDWQSWPVLPAVPEHLKEVYRRGLAQGNNPRAFSVLGDCQSQPEVFMGVYDNDPLAVRALPLPLQETVANFAGSFDRYSPTVKDGTTEGALLWALWNDNKEKRCKNNETPIDCELRTHRPSIVFVHVGTHWEARNRHYLEIVLNKILDQGAVPVLVTKADNREKDQRVNENLAALAVQYRLPLWNFWASVSHFPNNGLKPGSDMYLTDEALTVHRAGALQALDAVWRGVR